MEFQIKWETIPPSQVNGLAFDFEGYKRHFGSNFERIQSRFDRTLEGKLAF